MDNIKNNQLHMIADFEGDITELLKDRESGTYPIICTRDLVIFPTVLTLSYLAGSKVSQL